MQQQRRQWLEDALRESVDVDEALIHLAANYEHLLQAQGLNIASLEGVVTDLKAGNAELLSHLKLQAQQWSTANADLNEELNRQTGIIVRQRLTIQEQGEKIKELRDEVADLKEWVAEFQREERM